MAFRKIITIMLLLPVALFFLESCQTDYTPKPRGYFRIELPVKRYQGFDPPDCPYRFEIPTYANVIPDNNRFSEPCWINIVFTKFNGEINLSYKPVNGNLNKFIEDSRTLVYKHTVRAEAIDEKRVTIPEHRVFGLIYEIGGNAASSLQFYVTDSTHHFIRGALYFNVPPQSDSLAPVIEFIKEDIYRMIGGLEWKKTGVAVP